MTLVKTILLQLFTRGGGGGGVGAPSIPIPSPAKRNALITSALPYVNNEPHLGNIIGCVLSADAFARFSRLQGDNTLYICGTDEYGTATETKALQEKISCRVLCDKYFAIHRQIYEDFDIDFDHFGRTTTPHQTEIAQDIYLNLRRNGHLIKDKMSLLYCDSCSRFLADRYVEGTCPSCGFSDARGDQCDGCQKLLNATDLISPRCKIDGATPVIKESTHMFLNLSNFAQQLEAHMENSLARGDNWSANAIQTTRAWLREGLRPRCITRDLVWGTPVPVSAPVSESAPASQKNENGDIEDDADLAGKVFYVWFDAPIGYVSITASLTPEWRRWWTPNAERDGDVELYQFMGKDNTPFHTVIFPASLLGCDAKWTLVRHISTTEYLTYEGNKFSKSRGTGVFGSQMRASGIPVSVWRYYLFSSRPETSDADFNWDEFASRNNNELVKNPGNLVNRIVKFLWARYDGLVPDSTDPSPIDSALAADVGELVSTYTQHMRALRLRAAMAAAMAVASRGNLYLQDNRLDNALFEQQPARCATVLATSLDLLCVLSSLLYPFIPATSASINRQLGIPDDAGQPVMPEIKAGEKWTHLPRAFTPGHKIGQQEYLFQRIDESVIKALRSRHGGKPLETKPQEAGAAAATASTAPKSKRAAAASENVVANAYKAAEKALAALSIEDQAGLPASIHETREAIARQGAKIREMKSASVKPDARQVAAEVEVLRHLKDKFIAEMQSSMKAE